MALYICICFVLIFLSSYESHGKNIYFYHNKQDKTNHSRAEKFKSPGNQEGKYLCVNSTNASRIITLNDLESTVSQFSVLDSHRKQHININTENGCIEQHHLLLLSSLCYFPQEYNIQVNSKSGLGTARLSMITADLCRCRMGHRHLHLLLSTFSSSPLEAPQIIQRNDYPSPGCCGAILPLFIGTHSHLSPVLS